MSSKASLNIKRWREDPVTFVVEVFQCSPDEWQVDVLRALPQNRRLAMKACKGPGKTALISWVCWWFLSCYLHPKVAATSITSDNLSDGLWSEMAKWQQRSEFLKRAFTWTKTRIYANDHPETWFMSARTWPKGGDSSQQANTLAGLHADNMMFVLDEAGGIPDAVMAAAEAGLANDTGSAKTTAKILMAGNPTHTDGPLYRACTSERHLWHVTEISSDPDNPKRTPRVSVQWAREQIEKYGRDNPWVLVNVFGQFPPSSINALLGVEEVNQAMARSVNQDAVEFSQKRMGIDVARFGDDRSVIFKRQGLMSYIPIEMRGMRTTEIAARVMAEKIDFQSEMDFVDDTGHWGHGVIDNLFAAGYAPQGVQFHGPAINPRYKNRRAEMWIEMSEWVKRGGCLPKIPELVGELVTPTYTFVNGKFQLEDKDQVKQRLGRSPDLADALALTFAIADMPASMVNGINFSRNNGKVLHEYNPFENM